MVPVALLWHERQIVSVANLTPADGRDFVERAGVFGLQVHTTTYPLERADDAPTDLRAGRLRGAAVLLPVQDYRGDGSMR